MPRVPIFVLGMQRSGTTFAANLLAAHPEIAAVTAPQHQGVHESVFFSHFARLHGDWQNPAAKARALAGFFQSDYFLLTGLKATDFAGPPAQDAASFFRNVMDQYAARSGARAWVEKSPHHTLLADHIAAAFPDARFVCLIRDPVDLLASRLWSYGRAPPSYPRRAATVLQACASCVFHSRFLMDFGRRLGTDRVFCIDYATLKANPEAALAEVLSSCGLQPLAGLRPAFRPNSSFASQADRARTDRGRPCYRQDRHTGGPQHSVLGVAPDAKPQSYPSTDPLSPLGLDLGPKPQRSRPRLMTKDVKPLRTQVISSLEALYALREPLIALVAATGALVFHHPAFLFPWARAAVLNGMRPNCIGLWRGADLVGFAPLFVKRDKRALFARRLSPPLYGSSPPFDILLTCNEADGIAALGQAVLRQSWLDQNFPSTLTESRFATVWPDWFALQGFGVERKIGQGFMAVQITGKPEEVFAFAHGRQRKEIGRLARRTAAEARHEVYHSGAPLQPALDNMARVIRSSWKNSTEMKGKGLDALTDLAISLDDAGLLVLDFVFYQDQPIAYMMEILDPSGTRHAYHNAFDAAQKWLSPGVVILHAAVKQASSDGLKQYDYWGNRPYIGRLSNAMRPNVSVRIVNNSPMHLGQHAALKLLARSKSKSKVDPSDHD